MFALVSFCLLKQRSIKPQISPYLWGLVLVFFSDWMESIYSFLPGPLIRGELLLFTAVLYYTNISSLKKFIPYLVIISLALLVSTFISLADGRLIFSDDIGTFLYRLKLLQENFPNIPFYNPQWNAGIEQRDFFATGALLLHFLALPLRLFTGAPIEEFFNSFVAILGLILPATTIFIAARIMRLSLTASLLAALLSISTGLFWYRWVFKYGTLGYIAATGFYPLVLALLFQISVKKRNTSLFELLSFLVVFSLFILWPFAGVLVIPALIRCLIKVGRDCLAPKLLLTAVLLVGINSPWMYTFFASSHVEKFLTLDSSNSHEQELSSAAGPSAILDKTKKKNTSLKHPEVKLEKQSFLRYLRDNLIPCNPLLIFLLLPGLYFLPKGPRAYLTLTAGWLLFLAAVLSIFKPQLELHRMFIVLALVASLPVSVCLEHLLNAASDRKKHLARLSFAFCFAFLITGLFASARILANRSTEQIYFTTPIFSQIQNVIQNQHRSTGGRILFSGCVIHEFENGHLAPLAALTQVPLMASSHLHNLWWYKQIFPDEYIQAGDIGINKFLDLYNISAVFAHEPVWRKYFSERPNQYELVEKVGSFWFFRRKNFHETYFLEGSGKLINQTSNSVEIIAESKELVLKFNYLDHLQSSNCTISSREVSESVKLIKLNNCKVGSSVVINRRGLL